MVEVEEVLRIDACGMDPNLASLENALPCAEVISLGATHPAHRNLHFSDVRPTTNKSQ